MRRLILLTAPIAILMLAGCDLSEENSAVPRNIPINIQIKMKVGDVVYEDHNATIVVKGLDDREQLQWMQEFPYIGGQNNVFNIPGKYHHYRISVEKWGHKDEKVLSILELNQQRADGYSPGVLILGAQLPAEKLDDVTYYHKSGPTESPVAQASYSYSENGRLLHVANKTYDTEWQRFRIDSYSVFEYENNRLKTINRYAWSDDELLTAYAYSYNVSGEVSQIVQVDHVSTVTTTANFTYAADGTVRVNYASSNGNGFLYELEFANRNVKKERVVKGGATCQEGQFSYDKHINPYKHLGYVDFLLNNYSINNRITESTDYQCAIPSLIAESWQYQYNEKGYPTAGDITYKGGSTGRYTFTYK